MEPGGTMIDLAGVGGAEQTFTVRAIYDASDLGGYALAHLPVFDALIPPADYERLVGDPSVATVYASARDGVTPAAARAAIARALADHPTVEITGRDELCRRAGAELDPALRVYYSLFGLMILIALFGIVNTLTLSALERIRELGLLRVLGMQRRQVRTMLRWEAAIVAATGTVVGLALGALLGWAATRALELSATDVPIGLLAACAGAAVVASMLAASPAARRAARVDGCPPRRGHRIAWRAACIGTAWRSCAALSAQCQVMMKRRTQTIPASSGRKYVTTGSEEMPRVRHCSRTFRYSGRYVRIRTLTSW
jgi:putative ABC transport system permease protein